MPAKHAANVSLTRLRILLRTAKIQPIAVDKPNRRLRPFNAYTLAEIQGLLPHPHRRILMPGASQPTYDMEGFIP